MVRAEVRDCLHYFGAHDLHSGNDYELAAHAIAERVVKKLAALSPSGAQPVAVTKSDLRKIERYDRLARRRATWRRQIAELQRALNDSRRITLDYARERDKYQRYAAELKAEVDQLRASPAPRRALDRPGARGRGLDRRAGPVDAGAAVKPALTPDEWDDLSLIRLDTPYPGEEGDGESVMLD